MAVALAVILAVGMPALAVAQPEKVYVPEVTKQVDAGSGFDTLVAAGAGEDLKYQARGTLPSDYAELEWLDYHFVDTPEETIIPDADSVSVAVLDKDGALKSELSEEVESSFSEGVLKVTISDLKARGLDIGAGDIIQLEYDASLSETPTLGLADTNDNFIYVSYDSDERSEDSVEAQASVFSFAFEIAKVDAKDKTGLPGAQFTLRHEGYYVNGQGALGNEPHQFTTDENGSIVVSGLAFGEYELTETRAPEGYVKPEETWTFTVDAEADMELIVEGEFESYQNADEGIIIAHIENEKVGAAPSEGGFLSQTGGGRVVFAIAGLVLSLVLIGGATVIARRR